MSDSVDPPAALIRDARRLGLILRRAVGAPSEGLGDPLGEIPLAESAGDWFGAAQKVDCRLLPLETDDRDVASTPADTEMGELRSSGSLKPTAPLAPPSTPFLGSRRTPIGDIRSAIASPSISGMLS